MSAEVQIFFSTGRNSTAGNISRRYVELSAAPVMRFELKFVAATDIVFPEFAGSLLRGCFGHSLRNAACVTGSENCDGCCFRRQCSYAQIFEPVPVVGYKRRRSSGSPVTLVVEPMGMGEHRISKGDSFRFSIVLFGPALIEYKTALLAFRRAFLLGIGSRRERAELQQVKAENDQEIYENGKFLELSKPMELSIPEHFGSCSKLTLTFTTPLRLRKNGKNVLYSELRAEDILMTVVRRTADLYEQQLGVTLGLQFGELKKQARDADINCDGLKWVDLKRYSNRQKKSMYCGGHLGSVTLTGELKPFSKLLYLGQWLHVGKMASFGNGRYFLGQVK